MFKELCERGGKPSNPNGTIFGVDPRRKGVYWSAHAILVVGNLLLFPILQWQMSLKVVADLNLALAEQGLLEYAAEDHTGWAESGAAAAYGILTGALAAVLLFAMLAGCTYQRGPKAFATVSSTWCNAFTLALFYAMTLASLCAGIELALGYYMVISKSDAAVIAIIENPRFNASLLNVSDFEHPNNPFGITIPWRASLVAAASGVIDLVAVLLALRGWQGCLSCKEQSGPRVDEVPVATRTPLVRSTAASRAEQVSRGPSPSVVGYGT